MHRYAAESMRGLTDGDTSAGDLVIYLGLGGNPSSPNRISQFSSPSSHCWSRSELRAKNNSFQEKSFRYIAGRRIVQCTFHLDGMGLCLILTFFTYPNPRWVLSIPECFLPSACLGLAPPRSSHLPIYTFPPPSPPP